MGDRIDVDYDLLNGIVKRFSIEGDAIRQLTTATRNKVQALHGAGWIGRGSEAFFAEMQNKVLPGMDRLGQALEEAAGATQKIMAAFQQGEEEAAGMFRQGGDAAVGAAGAPGGAAGQQGANKLGGIGDKFMTGATVNRVRDSSFMGNAGGPAADGKFAMAGQGAGGEESGQKSSSGVEDKQYTVKMGGMADKMQSMGQVKMGDGSVFPKLDGAVDKMSTGGGVFDQKGASGAGGGESGQKSSSGVEDKQYTVKMGGAADKMQSIGQVKMGDGSVFPKLDGAVDKMSTGGGMFDQKGASGAGGGESGQKSSSGVEGRQYTVKMGDGSVFPKLAGAVDKMSTGAGGIFDQKGIIQDVSDQKGASGFDAKGTSGGAGGLGGVKISGPSGGNILDLKGSANKLDGL